MGVVTWTPLCTSIGVANFICFLLQMLFQDQWSAYAFPADDPQWFQYVTSLFLHGHWLHLTSNAFFLFAFGCALEKKVSPLVFAVIYFGSGVGGNVLFQMTESIAIGIGASGAIFGIICSMAIADPKALVITPGAPLPLPIVVFAPLYVLNEVFLMSQVYVDGKGTEISHIAHIGGGVAGALVAYLVIRKAKIK